MSNLKVYKASAGSGKTYTLALEYIRELLINRSDYSHRHVLAVTFTKDATGEMKDRILSELYGLAFACEDSVNFRRSLSKALTEAGRPMSEDEIQQKSKMVLQAILHDYSQLHVTTIDSFFQKVLRNLARELGKGSRFNLEMNNTKILSEAVRSLIEQANENQQLLDWLMAYIEGRLDEGSHWRVDREIMDFSRCIFNEFFQEHEQVLKDQLDGNPKIFTELWEQHAKIQSDCKAFFRQTHTEIEQLLQLHDLDVSDFSYKGTTISFFKKLSDGEYAKAELNKTIEACLTDPEKWTAGKHKRKEDIVGLATANLIPLLNQTLDVFRKFNTSRMISQNIHQLGLIGDITNEISRQNAENNRFMLSDTALFLNKMIDDSDTPFIYEKIGAEIKHVMIDEFQDTSRLQWKNFKSLLSEIIANNRFSLIVGDVKQSIYRWRNGDWNILNGIENELPVHLKLLNFNYRSERQVIDFNNHFFTHAAQLLNEKYQYHFGSVIDSPFLTSYDPADVVQQTKKEKDSGYVSVDFIPDKSEDAKYETLVLDKLLEQIRNLQQQGVAASQICILTRTNKSIIKIAEYLSAQKESCPELASEYFLNIVSDEAFQLNSSPALRIIIEALRVLTEPDNPVARARLEFYLKESVGNKHLDSPEALSRLPLLELTGHLYRYFDLKKIAGQSSYMFSFYDAVGNYLRENPSDLYAFLSFWEDELQFKSIPAGTSIEGIRAMTIHRSKGLQFHTVLLPFCDWDLYPEKNPVVWCGPKSGLYDLELLPVKYTQKMADTVFLDEYKKETGQSWMDNLNVLYVAFTRAEHNLLILSRSKKKLDSPEDIRKVSDLLRCSMEQINGYFNEENLHYEKGILEIPVEKEIEVSDNLLKQTPDILDAHFVSEAFNPDKSIFKQSNKSREFIHPELTAKDLYVSHGNIMHHLFSHIGTLDDITSAVDRLIFDGIVLPGEKEEYIRKVNEYIVNSHVEDWFSKKYRIYNESAILIEKDGDITTQRPDRVLFSDNETLIIDYKFGEPLPAHQKQMQQYSQLLQKMGYPHVRTFIWYVEKGLIC